MERNVHVVDPEVLIEEYRALLNEDGVQSLPLVVSGSSMSPFLVHGRDTVYLSKTPEHIGVGDILLYRRDSGMYVLHRVVGINGDELSLLGDAQIHIENGIRRDQVIAVASAAVRKGRHIAAGDPCWDFFEKLWPHMVGLRSLLLKILSAFSKFRA